MRRTFTLSLTLVLLWAMIAELNHALSGLRIYVFTGALFVAFAAVTQPLRSGMFTSAIGGLICDAHAPIAFGTHMLLFVLAHATLYHVRDRVPRDDNISAIIVALLTNLALFLVFSFGRIHDSPSPAAMWPRLLVDLLCSQVLLVVITPWFFALQTRALELVNLATAAIYEGRFSRRG